MCTVVNQEYTVGLLTLRRLLPGWRLPVHSLGCYERSSMASSIVGRSRHCQKLTMQPGELWWTFIIQGSPPTSPSDPGHPFPIF